MGVDPAGMGSDKAVISVMDIDWEKGEAKQTALEFLAKAKLNEFESFVRDRIRRYHPIVAAIDAVGVGTQLPDDLEADGIPVCRIFGGGAATENEIYHNRRSELYARLRDWLDPRKRGKIKLINNDDLRIQLTQMGPLFQTIKGKIRAPSKDEFKKSAGVSPDELDATVYCFIKESEWEEPGMFQIEYGKPSQYPKSEWESKEEEEEELEDWELGHFPGSDDIPIIG